MSPLQKPAAPLRRGRSRGQGMTEYIIIVALIAIATIGVVTAFGNKLRNLFSISAEALSGNASITNDACKPGDNLKKKNMKRFAQDNGY
jgi:pilus assembly protein Flp/PilA